MAIQIKDDSLDVTTGWMGPWCLVMKTSISGWGCSALHKVMKHALVKGMQVHSSYFNTVLWEIWLAGLPLLTALYELEQLQKQRPIWHHPVVPGSLQGSGKFGWSSRFQNGQRPLSVGYEECSTFLRGFTSPRGKNDWLKPNFKFLILCMFLAREEETASTAIEDGMQKRNSWSFT